MSFNKMVVRTWNQNIPFSALIELTYRCNLDCFFCYNDVALKGSPLSKEQYSRLLTDLRDLGTLSLALSGGEPLAHPDFLDLGEKARELGFLVRVKSNGHALRGSMAKRIRERIDPYSIEISLHGACAETHDRQTRIPGSFDRLMRNIPQVLETGLRIVLSSPMTRWNENELEAMYALADGLGVDLRMTPQVTPRDNGDREPLSLTPSLDAQGKLRRLQEARLAAKKATLAVTKPKALVQQDMEQDPGSDPRSVTTHCGSGSAGLVVDPYGSVFPCVQWRRSIGNLHEQSVKEIWAGSNELTEIRRLNREVKGFIDGQGPEVKSSGFCPGLAEQLTGSHVKLYPEIRERIQVLKNLQDPAREKESSS